jgi:hypothetical protein
MNKKYFKKSLEDLEEIEEKDLFSNIAYLIIFQKYFSKFYLNFMRHEAEIAKTEI